MITRIEKLPEEQLKRIRRMIGEAFVSNELFHNWGTEAERRDDVLKYVDIYTKYVYRTGALYGNEELTGFIGLEDSGNAPVFPRIGMILKMFASFRWSRMKSLLNYIKQISGSNEKYAKERHLDTLLVCVDKDHQGKGIASDLIRFAKEKADEAGLPLLFDTDMRSYAEMYQHFGCELYNSVTADNGVTRYSLCYHPEKTEKQTEEYTC